MKPAVLALENGEIFQGVAIGAEGQAVGEVVFNTAMTGYQEILTDPSYAQQIVTLTYPHIGNTGTNAEDFESTKAYAVGLVIRDLPLLESNWRAEHSLSDFLKAQNVVAIAGIDTRKLTRILREQGAQRGCIMAGDVDEAQALSAAKAFAGLENMDLAKEVTTENSYTWRTGVWHWADAAEAGKAKLVSDEGLSVVAYDFGVKRNILRMLAERGCNVMVVPATTPAADVLAMKPNGVFLSNGPGDPAPCDYAIAAIKTFLEKDVPLFGICLGHQLLALALGAKTMKMKFGHHGANHPVKDLKTGQVMITSQNHGFMVDETSLSDVIEVTHRSLFDDSIQGIAHKTKKAFSFQGHPEASPGPHDVAGLFDEFVGAMSK